MINLSWHELQNKLPQHLRRALLQSSVGGMHLADMAENALSLAAGKRGEEQNLFLSLGLDMLLTQFEGDCLDYNLASQLKTLHNKTSFLPAPVLSIVDWLLANHTPPADQRYFYRLLEEKKKKKMLYDELKEMVSPGSNESKILKLDMEMIEADDKA